MIFVVGVREAARALLGATTHVDGTARIQTVAREDNPELWALIEAFRRRTGVPILLNTSFNNHREPIVDSVDEAMAHIAAHGSGHSEAIVTNDASAARRFERGVDAACVYVNASTRFTDGGEFGMGAEIGNSTQKLHARGPIGLRELCASKYVVVGDGHVRG